jgi:hypothetical protein
MIEKINQSAIAQILEYFSVLSLVFFLASSAKKGMDTLEIVRLVIGSLGSGVFRFGSIYF